MGEVYRAWDTVLEREVAIKAIPAEFAREPEQLTRFEREAKLLASFNHPNIAIIHGFEKTESGSFIILELVEGETLAQKLRRGPLPSDEAVRVGAQVAAALEAAHQRGIVHRDLKPGNVMVTASGVVKVLDFGIAKQLVPGAGDADGAEWPEGLVDTMVATGQADRLTATGALLGTIPYMSPESLRGQAPDQRSDIWSFGCLIFELLAARHPFDRGTMVDTFGAILQEEPDWHLLPADTPAAVRTVVGECLRKDPAARLQDIREARLESATPAAGAATPSSNPAAKLAAGAVAVVLLMLMLLVAFNAGGLRDRLLTSGAASAPLSAATVQSLAVLPLENLSGNPQDDAFAAGVTEEITTQLAKLPGLRVVARSAAMRFARRPVDFAEVGAMLGVDAVLDGSVRRSGGQLRVSAQLVEVGSGMNVWADDFDREWSLDNLIGMQEEIALQIAAVLDIRLTPQQRQNLAAVPTADAEAYEFYLRGLSHLIIGSREDHLVGIELLRQAIAADPDFAQARAKLATAYALMVEWGYDSDPRWLALADTEARRALALSPDASVAYEALLVQASREGDGRELRDLSKQLLQADPNNVTGEFMLGYGYVRYGFLDAGEQRFQAALRLDPFFLPARMNLGTILDLRGDPRAAEQLMGDLLGEYPGHPLITCFLAYYIAKQGRIDEAIALLEPLQGVHPLSTLMLALTYSLAGDFETAREFETPELTAFVTSAPWPPYYMAQVYALQNRGADAVQLLDGQVRRGFTYSILETWPVYAPLRGQPEFERLIETIKSENCGFAAEDAYLRAAYERDCT